MVAGLVVSAVMQECVTWLYQQVNDSQKCESQPVHSHPHLISTEG